MILSEDNSEIKDSRIPSEIITILKKSGTMRYKELKDNLQISGPTLSIHLKSLVNHNAIKFEKKGREKFYSLNERITEDVERKIDMFASEYLWHVDKKLNWTDEGSEYESAYEAYNDIHGMIGTYFLFTLLKSIETGEDWFKGFSNKWLGVYITEFFGRSLFQNFDSSDLPYYLGKNWSKFFKESNQKLDKKSKQTLKNYFNNLKEMYPEHYDALENAFKGKTTKKPKGNQ